MKKQLRYAFITGVLIGLLIPNLFAQDKEDNRLFTDIEVSTERSGGKEVTVEVSFQTPLPGDSNVRISLYNQIDNRRVDWTSFQTEGASQESASLGPYENLWPGTYKIVIRYRPTGDQSIPSERKGYTRFASREFKTGSDVPSPKEQRQNFRRRKKNILLKIRSFYVQFYPEFRRLRNRPLSENEAKKQKEELAKKTEKKRSSITESISELDQQHSTGSPFQDEVDDLLELGDVLKQFSKRQLQTIVKEWEPGDPRYYSMNRAQRIKHEIASPGDLRAHLLEELYDQLPSEEGPTKSLFNEVNRWLLSRYRDLLTVLSKSFDADAGISKFRLASTDLESTGQKEKRSKWKTKIQNVLWLFRDLPGSSQETGMLLQQGRRIRKNLRTLEEQIRSLKNIREKESPEKRITVVFDRFLSFLDEYIRIQWNQLEPLTKFPETYFSFLHDRLIHIMDVAPEQKKRTREVIDEIDDWQNRYSDQLTSTLEVLKKNPGKTGDQVTEKIKTLLSKEKKEENSGGRRDNEPTIRSFIQQQDNTKKLRSLRGELQFLKKYTKRVRKEIKTIDDRYDKAKNVLRYRMKGEKPENSEKRDPGIFTSSTAIGYVNYMSRKLENLLNEFQKKKSQFDR